MSDRTRFLVDPIVTTNPVTIQVLGICSALAVTTTLSTALVMSAALAFVLTVSNGVISLIRNHIPRSIRLILENKRAFRAQLRAIYRASRNRTVRVLLPMISCVSELREALEVIDEVRGQLDRHGVEYDPDLPVGAMIEVPSAAILAERTTDSPPAPSGARGASRSRPAPSSAHGCAPPRRSGASAGGRSDPKPG